MSDGLNQNGWNEYSRLVLKELESLSTAIENLNREMQDIRGELTEIRVREDRVKEIKEWKERIDDVASPAQLKELSDDVQDLKMFKTKAITIFAVVQFFMGIAMWAIKSF
tara:strand:- start:1095 stop:1424 length:330 start_codon:yes stop_codon:yes gene_type:complete